MATKTYITKLVGKKTPNTTMTGNTEKQAEIEDWIASHTDSIVGEVTILTEEFQFSIEEL